MIDEHFADLAKVMKHKANIDFADVASWYCNHYYMAGEYIHSYVPVIAELFIIYMDKYKLTTLPVFAKRMRPDNGFRSKFRDLDESYNDNYHYRVVAECCSILMMTRIDAIPGYKI